MESSEDRPIDLTFYGRVLWRRKSLILLCMIALLCGSTVAVNFIPDQYQSEAMLLIQDRQPLAREIENVLGGWRQPASGFRRDEERMSQLIGRVRSRPFLERVVKILQMSEDPRIREEARGQLGNYPGLTEEELAIRLLVDALQSRIRFASAGPGLYRVLVTDHSAENAHLLAKWISELFVDITIQKELDQIRIARDFGAEQLRVYEEQLDRSEAALEAYRGTVIEQNLSGNIVNSENQALAENILRRLEDRAATSAATVHPLERAADAAGVVPGGVARLTENPQIMDLSRRVSSSLIRSLEERLAASATEGSTWPPTGEVNVLRRDLYRELESLVGELYPEAEPDEAKAIVAYTFALVESNIQTTVSGELKRRIQEFKRLAQMRPVDEMELSRLEEEVAKNRELLKSFRAQMVASDVSQAVETTNLGMRIEIIDPARIPLRPTRPDRMKIILAACLVGPIVGIGFAFLGELLDPTLRSIADIKRVAPEPILGTIPLVSKLQPRRRGFRRYWIPATATGIVILTVVFFLARTTVMRDWEPSGQPVQVIDPGQGVSQ